MQERFNNWLESIQGTSFQFLAQKEFLIAAGVVLGLLILLLILRLRPTRRIRAFKGEAGYVEISRHALLEMVYSACEQMPEVRKPSIKIKARRKLNLSIRIRVDGSAHLRDTASFLQTHLKDALENNLGIERLGEIEILVTGVRPSSKPKVDLNPPAKDEFVIPKPKTIKSPSAAPTPQSEPTPETPAKEEPALQPEPAQSTPPVAHPDPSAPKPAERQNEKEEEEPPKTEPKKIGPSFFEKKKK